MQTGSMKRILTAVAAAILCASCAKPDERVPDNNCTLSTLKAFVYYDSEDVSKNEELDLLGGMYIPDKGSASFTFPDDEVKYNANTLKQCRLEATIPSTARLEMTDENGAGLGIGLEGWHDLYNRTIYFRVVAANGDIFQYKVSCRCKF